MEDEKETLRKGKKGDEKEIKTLVSTVLSGYDIKTDSHTDSDIEDITKNYNKNGGLFKVLTVPSKNSTSDEKEVKERIVGSYGIYKLNKNDCELRKMYLYKNFQGKGLGKLMLLDSFKEAKTLGFKRMVLETNGKLKKSLGMYKKYGFKFYKPKTFHAKKGRADLAMEISLL